ncbi:hypothetical protein FJ444_09680 [Aestuariibacter sp. GS-14]|uniref:hypothetical protein n=1 Tax=Aestuariibacter sp. GS-14 TaxID=2590670 RepID=UPI0011275E12|nr:hypothetical protein [Aestuariibacter sp. GS-14]TPV58307.1 hypothetical protein FJ444_09680 [Aestuariibacter sp. GS-14]
MIMLRKLRGMATAICAGLLLVTASGAIANELSAIKKVSESKELGTLRDNYRACVVAKAKLYLKVNSIDSTIVHAPIACKRELLSIRQFLLSGAFKVDVVDQLMDSVREGVEIDLVNSVYDEVLKKKGIQP